MKLRTIFFLSFLFFATMLTQTAFAQTSSADIKVDDLSDVQIREFMKRAQAIGYDDAQLEQMAAAQGIPATEIQKLRSRIEKIRKTDGESGNGNQSPQQQEQQRDNSRTYQNTDTAKNILKDNQNQQRQNIFDDLRPKIYGAELFKNGNITFEPNLRMATPRNYIIGPDDELLIDLTGDNEKDYKLKVSPDGTIRLQYVGLIAVAGLSVEQASAKIRRAMLPTYPALSSGRTKVTINIGNIRSIKVILTGAITKPGTYTLPSLATVFNALYASGGPNANGSFRNIQVIRNNQVISNIDVYDFIRNGIQKGNIRLQDQDVINVPVYQTRVEIVGEVKIPALFEMVKGESLAEALDFAGGFTNQAYTGKIKILQNTAKERRITDVNAENFANYIPQNGDKFMVETILDRFENRVEIDGAVFRPGFYELDKGLTLKGLIEKADGLTEDAFLNRAYINRLNKDNTLSLIPFDLQKLMAGTAPDITLQREDKIMISSLFDLRDEYIVNVQGEVRAPGTFKFADNMTLEDLIQMAGGFNEGATPNRVEISRRTKNSDAASASARTAEVFTVNVDQNLKLQGAPFILKPFDIVTVRNAEGYSVQKQVKLEGEVVYPGLYTITRKDERISELIKRAGGLTSSAYADGASLKRPGAEKVNPKDKNAISSKEEESVKLLNLKRLQETGVKDTLATEVEQQLIQSDLVGINLVGIMKSPFSKQDLIVEDGDIIRVPRVLQTVKVTGEVLNPNSIVYLPGKSLKQYINGAGGYTTNARKNGTYIKYANGSAAAVSKFLFFNNYPIVKPGAEILVPKRAEREKISPQAWIGIGTGLASLAAIIVSLLK